MAPNARLDAVGIVHRGRVHVHRCRRVAVSVNFNGDTTGEDFPPSATVGRVKKWAVSKKAFNLQSVDATEHVLQMCNSSTRPDEDVHIGTLVTAPDCRLCFDLVAKQRVEGRQCPARLWAPTSGSSACIWRQVHSRAAWSAGGGA
ncbi:MAG: hypothetical protein M5U09_26750 [Gammaproteobacteria bacterium]|nr:hypothetical protein [Gammaproteobacteria bacterium]